MKNIIHANFGRIGFHRHQRFHADIYSSERGKHQYEVDAESATSAYFRIIAMAFRQGVTVIHCVVMFEGLIADRLTNQIPVKVWHRPKQSASGF